MAQHRVHIMVVEPSLIIRSGITSVLLNIESLGIDVAAVGDVSRLRAEIELLEPNVVIVNPQYLGLAISIDSLRRDGVKFVALCSVMLEASQLRSYDASISIFDNQDVIEQTLSKLVTDEQEGAVELTLREKEVVAYVAKGFSNKDIADVMNISTHTVTTHRRNIASKLKIHNPSGLTIYALVNGLVDMSEIG